jgi:hypothetical protein
LALLRVQQIGHPVAHGGQSTAAALALAVVVLAIMFASVLVMIRERRNSCGSLGLKLAREAERWLRDQSPPPDPDHQI